MTDKAALSKQLVAVELAADDCLNIAVCKTIPIQALAKQSLSGALAAEAEAKLSDDPVFAPVRRLRDWARLTARSVSERGAALDVQEFSKILGDVKAVAARDPAGAFVGLIEKAEALQKMLTWTA
ncbi:MAG TPA: hypothetical protein VL371_07120 [Gemmataceae bacterium]|jgi:hypothetical protein|nr:hypothetical protein [Gemmataceae bacterium]